ncbi:hypothetical protein [Pseudobacteriovorax antillogorgiicola]|uniref:Lipoprotein n=1 Tax=Pseudobacteriovorax antillogorgiicola TaxID=1513793 RepID=A0A1Y6C1N8_9BACT|nr:hypothetical protein [Pseudobacteriovorax antillogorgiicola]TCS51210.1 hypothetical protein EDD56_11194 [Pseudobacteriovorax antillogorgiicola]SMF37125.1 hypothetical protein SAMN06296036_11184 [Pseudobacteriovorax antillogorgiicola]
MIKGLVFSMLCQVSVACVSGSSGEWVLADGYRSKNPKSKFKEDRKECQLRVAEAQEEGFSKKVSRMAFDHCMQQNGWTER